MLLCVRAGGGPAGGQARGRNISLRDNGKVVEIVMVIVIRSLHTPQAADSVGQPNDLLALVHSF